MVNRQSEMQSSTVGLRDTPSVPGDASLSYLNEGAANIIYRLAVKDPTPQPTEIEEYGAGTPPPSEIDPYDQQTAHLLAFDKKLLRVRKDLPTTLPCAISQANWERLIAPLFPTEQLVQQSLVQLRPGNIIKRLNEDLQVWESQFPLNDHSHGLNGRPAKRRGVFLANDEYGLLVTDMTPGPLGEHVLEFKPKWLSQSRSAPKSSKRCRQCARTAQLNATRSRRGEPKLTAFCSLDLVSSDPRNTMHVAQILASVKGDVPRLARWIEKTSLLQRLRDHQETLDKLGVFEAKATDENFLTAMTLRDCSVFVRLPAKGGDEDEIEARIGDLDVKSAKKLEYWTNTERSLIDEGWYTATEKAEDSQPVLCLLSPERWSLDS